MRYRRMRTASLALLLTACTVVPPRDAGVPDAGGDAGADVPQQDVPGVDAAADEASAMDAPGSDAPDGPEVGDTGSDASDTVDTGPDAGPCGVTCPGALVCAERRPGEYGCEPVPVNGVCPGGWQLCGGRCWNVGSPLHCASCADQCSDAQFCGALSDGARACM